jgi:hypothetical protein
MQTGNTATAVNNIQCCKQQNEEAWRRDLRDAVSPFVTALSNATTVDEAKEVFDSLLDGLNDAMQYTDEVPIVKGMRRAGQIEKVTEMLWEHIEIDRALVHDTLGGDREAADEMVSLLVQGWALFPHGTTYRKSAAFEQLLEWFPQPEVPF